MKNNLEKNIKQSLENHEMPYNPAAWTAMNAKLNTVKPVTATPTSNLKWYMAAASVVAISIVAYVVFNHSSEIKKTIPEQTQTSEIVDNDIKLTIDEENKHNESNSNKEHSNLPEEEVNAPEHNRKTNPIVDNTLTPNPQYSSIDSEEAESSQGEASDDGSTNIADRSPNKSSNSETPSTFKNYILPNVSEICEGEIATIKNTNDVALIIEGPEMYFIIPPHSERKVRMNKEGVHEISVHVEQSLKKTSTFMVKSTPKAEFIVDTDTKFKKGLPITKLEATTSGSEFSWIIGKDNFKGREITANLFKKGSHDITLTVKGSNGCSKTTTRPIILEKRYNLMAVNSFVPEDTDPRLNTFMPFALTQRDVKFSLIIIDPSDGRIVYRTNDANLPWNGSDRTTGAKVKFGTTYIWKVTIQNPEPNEENEYAGNITPIQR